jgi:hypothetical protein
MNIVFFGKEANNLNFFSIIKKTNPSLGKGYTEPFGSRHQQNLKIHVKKFNPAVMQTSALCPSI